MACDLNVGLGSQRRLIDRGGAVGRCSVMSWVDDRAALEGLCRPSCQPGVLRSPGRQAGWQTLHDGWQTLVLAELQPWTACRGVLLI